MIETELEISNIKYLENNKMNEKNIGVAFGMKNSQDIFIIPRTISTPSFVEMQYELLDAICCQGREIDTSVQEPIQVNEEEPAVDQQNK